MKKLLFNRLWIFLCTFCFLMLTGAVAEAIPIGPDVVVTGSATYDTSFSFVDNATHSGTMTATIGGTDTNTTYGASSNVFLAGSALGANPLMGTLTDTGDGFGVIGTAAGSGATADSEFGIGVDILMNITNSSATDIYQVTVRTTFGNSVNSIGTDTYVESEFTLDQRLSTVLPPGTEEFFTHLVTDTVNGNEVGGNPVASFGGPLSETGSDMFMLTLNPGEMYILEGVWTMEGGAFDATSEAFLDDFNAFISVYDVANQTTPIPEPATLLLLGTGLTGLAEIRRRRKVRE